MAVKLEPILQTTEDESDIKVKGEHLLHGTFQDNVTTNGEPVYETGMSNNVIIIQPVQFQDGLNDVKPEYESETISHYDASSEQYIEENPNNMSTYEANETDKKESKKSKDCEEVHKCDLCNMEFMKRKELLRHICKKHIDKKAFYCKVCNTKIEKGASGLKHIASHTSIKCPLCGLEDLSSIYALKRHVIDKHSDMKICSLCRVEVYGNAESLANHIIKHDERKCTLCTKYHIFPQSWHQLVMTPSSFCHTITEEIHYCCFCDYSNKQIGELSAHISRSHLPCPPNKYNVKPKPVEKCKICGIVFISRDDLYRHICKKHVKRKALLCNICNTEVENGNDSLTHMESHATVKCLLCGIEDLPSINAMKVHIIEKHSDIRSCSLCDVETDLNAESLADHVVEHQFKSDKRKCAICTGYHSFPHRFTSNTLRASCFGRTFRKVYNRCCFCDYSNARMTEVAQHINKFHLSKGPSANCSEIQAELNCPFNCTKTLKSPEQLSRHMIKKHESRTNVQCTFCKSIIQKNGIRKHLLDAHSSRQCPLCDATFCGDNNQGVAELQDHLFSHDIPVHCPLCSEVQNGMEVEDHLKSAHRVNTLKQCPFCDKTQGNLRGHISQMHISTMCLLCGKSIKGPRGLISHMATHETYKCNICDLAVKEVKKNSNNKWEKHIYEHESKSGQFIKCHFCPELFIDLMSYESHLTEHYKEMSPSEAMDETPPYPSLVQSSFDMGTTVCKSEAVASSNANDSQSKHGIKCSLLDSEIAVTGEASSPTKTEPFHTATWFPQSETYAKPPQTNLQKKKSNVKVKCHICSELLTDMEKYREHFRKVHHKTKKCKTNKMFDVASNGMSRITFRITSDIATKPHQSNNKSQASRTKCHFCPEVLPDAKSYKEHLVLHRQRDAVTCGMCNKQFIVKDALVNHLLNNQCSKVAKCILCSKLFTDIKSYEEHMAVLHNKEIGRRLGGIDHMESPDSGNANDITIKSISQTYSASANKVENLNLDKVVTPEKRKIQKSCDGVGLQQTKSDKPIKKTRYLSNGPRQLLVCPYNCSGTRRTPSELSRHICKQHADGKDVRCAFCDTTIRKSQIRNHLLGVHTSIKCALCDSTFSGEYCQGGRELKTHILNSHDISVQCPLCGERKNGYEMEQHLKNVHLLKSSGDCPICSEPKTGLISHVSGKHINTSCTLCEKTVPGAKNFTDHLITHQSHMCKICDVSIERTGSRNKTWQRHLDKHESQCMKIIKCYFCSELFTDVNTYEEHIMGHFEQRGQSLSE